MKKEFVLCASKVFVDSLGWWPLVNVFLSTNFDQPSKDVFHLFHGGPYYAYKNSKNIDNELGYHPQLSTKTPKIWNELCFDARKINAEFVENVKIDPQEYVLQGSSSLYYLQKLK